MHKKILAGSIYLFVVLLLSILIVLDVNVPQLGYYANLPLVFLVLMVVLSPLLAITNWITKEFEII